MQHHNYSLSDLENMLPWEREIYVDMLITYIKEENEKEKRRKRKQNVFKKEEKRKDLKEENKRKQIIPYYPI